MFGLIFFIAILAGWLFWRYQNKAKQRVAPIPPNLGAILEKEVAYYRKLSEEEKLHFTRETIDFLQTTRIDGIGTEIDDTDRVLVAASAVIPVFAFPGWTYNNLSDVLIYDDHFDEEFRSKGQNRQFMGMVGSGYMNGKMLLSKPALREGFANKTDKNNTAIHEFVHLVDKSDGAIDGIPEVFVDKQFILPWLDLVRRKINEIRNNDSDINPYGATDKTEFFAVAAEYFFERPDLLKSKHPQLYSMLEQIFKQEP